MALSVKNMLGGSGGSNAPYVWSKSEIIHYVTYKEYTNKAPFTLSTVATSSSISFVYGDDFAFDDATGTFSIVNPVSGTCSYNGTSTITRGKYFIIAGYEQYLFRANTISSNFTRIYNNSSGIGVQLTDTTYPYYWYHATESTKHEFVEYVYSKNSNDFPIAGEYDGFYYLKIQNLADYFIHEYKAHNSDIKADTFVDFVNNAYSVEDIIPSDHHYPKAIKMDSDTVLFSVATGSYLNLYFYVVKFNGNSMSLGTALGGERYGAQNFTSIKRISDNKAIYITASNSSNACYAYVLSINDLVLTRTATNLNTYCFLSSDIYEFSEGKYVCAIVTESSTNKPTVITFTVNDNNTITVNKRLTLTEVAGWSYFFPFNFIQLNQYEYLVLGGTYSSDNYSVSNFIRVSVDSSGILTQGAVTNFSINGGYRQSGYGTLVPTSFVEKVYGIDNTYLFTYAKYNASTSCVMPFTVSDLDYSITIKPVTELRIDLTSLKQFYIDYQCYYLNKATSPRTYFKYGLVDDRIVTIDSERPITDLIGDVISNVIEFVYYIDSSLYFYFRQNPNNTAYYSPCFNSSVIEPANESAIGVALEDIHSGSFGKVVSFRK